MKNNRNRTCQKYEIQGQVYVSNYLKLREIQKFRYEIL